jgi:hypothetical protein
MITQMKTIRAIWRFAYWDDARTRWTIFNIGTINNVFLISTHFDPFFIYELKGDLSI